MIVFLFFFSLNLCTADEFEKIFGAVQMWNLAIVLIFSLSLSSVHFVLTLFFTFDSIKTKQSSEHERNVFLGSIIEQLVCLFLWQHSRWLDTCLYDQTGCLLIHYHLIWFVMLALRKRINQIPATIHLGWSWNFLVSMNSRTNLTDESILTWSKQKTCASDLHEIIKKDIFSFFSSDDVKEQPWVGWSTEKSISGCAEFLLILSSIDWKDRTRQTDRRNQL